MEGKNSSVMQVSERVLQGELMHDGVLMVKYRISYPLFYSSCFPGVAAALSRHYMDSAQVYRDYIATQLLGMAVEQYEYAMENSFPFHNYEAISEYTVTFNSFLLVSLYTDRYEFTGGAHGNTARTSETWNIKRRRRMALSEFFPCGTNWREEVLSCVRRQIRRQMDTGEGMYFEDYPRLVEETFNPDSFFISEKGLAVYYQQYDIAPYSSGIPVFIVATL